MAYVEVWKEGKLIIRRQVGEEKARKGCRIRLGSAGQVRVKIGETKQVGKFEVRMFAGDIPEAKQVTEEGSLDLSEPGKGPVNAASTASTFSGTTMSDVREEASYFPEIEGYEVTGRLGEGGMGTVWRAVQLSTHREVALKLLSERRFASQKSRLRFVREVELTASLVHPNIARLYDSGLYRGIYYYAMELVDGVHLDQYVKEQNLSQRQILELMWIVCQAVHHAHKRGVIHRDLKPSNILVSQDGQPHVLDFGLAKAFLRESSDVTVSIEGDVAGTLAYMSPEQAMGRKEQMDTRTDVYSLGIILYQFLTGESLHELSGTRFEIIRKIVEENVRSPREIQRDIDCDLEALLLKALARDPDDRYLSAGEMADDIDNYLNGKPLMARSPTTIYFLRKKVSKYRRHISIAAAVLVVFIGIFLLAYSIGVQSGGKVKVAQKEPEVQRKAAELESQTLGKNDEETPVAIKPLKEESISTKESQGQSEDKENLPVLSPVNGAAENARPTPEILYGKRFRFSWRTEKGSGNNGIATLHNDGTISGIRSDNESFWLIDEEGRLVFKHQDGRVSSIFTHVNQRDGKWFFSGPFQFNQAVEHLLEEVGSETISGSPTKNAEVKSQSPAAPVSPDDLKRGLVFHLNFDSEPVGRIIPDLSGQGNNGKAVNVQWITDGHRGGSVQFGLTKSYITVSNNASLNPPQLTLSAWIKTSYQDWVWRRIFDKGTGQGYVLSMCGDDKDKSFQGEVDIEPGKTWAHSGIKVTDGRWHHVLGTFDGTDAKIYVDGRPAGKPARWEGEIPYTAYDLTIGANRSNPNPALGEVDASFNGMMDDVMMFNRALSAEEVRTLFDLQKRAENGVSPADGAVVNATKIDLTWSGSTQDLSYDVYFGESSSSVMGANHESPEFKQNQTNKSFTATGLAFNKTYYWRVDVLKSDGNVVPGMAWAVNTRPPPPSSELTVVNGSFESPTIAEAIAKGIPGQSGLWAANGPINGWVGTGGLARVMVVEGNQNFYWNDPQKESIEQTLGYVAGEVGKTYTIQYTRQIIAKPSIATLKFRAELLVGGKVVDFEEFYNASVGKGVHRLKYTNYGKDTGQTLAIRFTADSSKGWTKPSEVQSVFIDDVKLVTGDNAIRTR